MRLEPQFESQVVSSFVAIEIRAQLAVVALLQDVRPWIARPCELLYVIAIAFKISLELRESLIMGLKREEMQVTPGIGEHGNKPTLVVLGRCGDRYGVQVDLVSAVQGRTLSCNLR